MDTFIGKVNARMYAFYQIEGEEKEKMATEMVKTVEKEIEPLLEGAAPFFGGSETLTLAEVCAPYAHSCLTLPLFCVWDEF